MFESVAAHYGDAQDDFVDADNVQLPWPSAWGGMQWGWRVVSLKDTFPGELLALCVREKDVGPQEVLGEWREAETPADSSADRGRRAEGGGARGQPACRGGGGEAGPEKIGEIPVRSGDARGPDVPQAFAAVQGRPGSERAGGRREREDVIDVDAEPPPPPLGRHLFHPSPPDRGAPDGCRVGLGKEEAGGTSQACGCGCPSGSFPLSRRWVGGLGSACGAVSGMRGCVTCVRACLEPRRVCWSSA